MSKKSNDPATTPVFLAYGDDYRVEAKAREILEALCPPAERDLGLEQIDGQTATLEAAERAVGQTLMALRTRSFLGTRKLVWLRQAVMFSPNVLNSSEKYKSLAEALTAEIKRGFPAGHRLLVTADKVDGRSAFFKACEATGAVFKYETPEKSREAQDYAESMVRSFLAEHQLEARPDVIAALVARAGTDARQLAQEVAKLKCWAGTRPHLEQADIQAVTSFARQADFWEFADAVLARQGERALRMLRQLLFQGESPRGLLANLINRYRDILLLHECARRKWVTTVNRTARWTDDDAAEQCLSQLDRERDPRRYHPYRTGILLEQVSKHTRPQLVRGLRAAVAAYERLNLSRLPESLQMELMVLDLMRAGAESETTPRG